MKNVIRYLNNKGLTASETAEKLGVSKKTVLRIGKRNNIFFRNIPKRFDTVDPVIVKKLLKRGYTVKQVAKLLHKSVKTINDVCLRNNIKYETYLNLKLNKKEKSFLIGSILGDGSLKFSGKSAAFITGHSLKQKEYCLWKAKTLGRFLGNTYYHSRYDNRTKKVYNGITLYTKSNLELGKWHSLLYTPKKRICSELLKYYNAFSLAVHYMDDGCKTKGSYLLATHSFDIESLKVFIKHCEQTFQISWNINKSHGLYLPTKYRDRFKSLIEPYIHPELLYKL